MIFKPTRREVLKYAGMGALAFGVPLLLKVKPAYAVIGLVQTGDAYSGSGNISASINNTTAGNGLLVFASASPIAGFGSPTISGESWEYDDVYDAPIGVIEYIYYVKNLQSGGTKTFQTTNSFTAWKARIIEIQNQDTAASMITSTSGTWTGSGTQSTTSLTTTSDHMAIFAICSIYGYNGGQSLTTGSPQTLIHIGNSSAPPFTTSANYLLDVNQGLNTSTFTFPSASWLQFSVAIKLSGGGGPPPGGLVAKHRRKQ